MRSGTLPGAVGGVTDAEKGGRTRLLRVTAAATFLIFFQAFMVAPILPRLADLFHVSVTTMGLIVPAYLIPYGLATLVYGPLSDRVGRGPIIVSSLLAFLVLTAATAAVGLMPALLALRLLTGLGASGVVPIALALVSDLFLSRSGGGLWVCSSAPWRGRWPLGPPPGPYSSPSSPGGASSWASRALPPSSWSCSGPTVPCSTRWFPVLTLAMGLNMLGIVRWTWLRLPSGRAAVSSGPVSAFALGLPFGLAASPCTLPILITVLTVAAGRGSAAFGLVGLAAFGLGRSVPVLLLGHVSDRARALPRLRCLTPSLRRGAGLLIIAISVYVLTLGRGLLG